MFLKPIRVGCLLPCDAINTIFSNVEGILSVNVELFTCMRQKSLGEAFSYLAPFLKLYSTYANNFQNANETLQVGTSLILLDFLEGKPGNEVAGMLDSWVLEQN